MPFIQILWAIEELLVGGSRIFYYLKRSQKNSQKKSGDSKELKKAEREYYQKKVKLDRQLLDLEKQKLLDQVEIQKEQLELQQIELEFQAELSGKRFQMLREFQRENIDLKWREIQQDWDSKQNWFSKINRIESERILNKYAECLLILTSPPKIAKDPSLSLFRDLDFELEMRNLDDFLEKYYPSRNNSHPVKHYSNYFQEPIGKIEIEQLHYLLNRISTYVIYPDITANKITFRIAFWAINGELEFFPETIKWNWQETKKQLIAEGKTEAESILEIRDLFVQCYQVITAFLSDSYYLSVDPLYNVKFISLYREDKLQLPDKLVANFEELEKQQQTDYLNYLEQSLKSEFTKSTKITGEVLNMTNNNSGTQLEATEIRHQFADRLSKMAQIISQSEKKGNSRGTSGALALSTLVNDLNEEINNLYSGKFRFLMIGEFNRGKSSILNALFREAELLPMGVTPTTAIPTLIKYGEDKKVLIYKKGGKVESLTIEEYKKEYTRNSKKKHFRNIFKDWKTRLDQWFNNVKSAEIHYPNQILLNGEEFIDTAGLNETELRNQQTFAYLEKCDAIIFVLQASDQQFTQKEKEYLKKFLVKKQEIENQEIQGKKMTSNKENINKVRPIFYLINKWEEIEERVKKGELEEDAKNDIHDIFVEGFSECLNISQAEAECLWGDTVFNLYAKNALDRINNAKSQPDLLNSALNGTGLDLFRERLSEFSVNERLITELKRTLNTASMVTYGVLSKVENRLFGLKDNIKTLEEKIEKTKSPVETMKRIVQEMKYELTRDAELCVVTIGEQYRQFFYDISENFEREFEMPSVEGLKDNQREEYTEVLEKKLADYRQKKLEQWYQMAQGNLVMAIDKLKGYFLEKTDEYTKKGEVIKQILAQSDDVNAKNFSSSSINLDDSQGNSSLTTAEGGSAIGKMITGGTLGSIGTFASGAGIAAAANAYLGTHIVLAVGLSLTGVGALLLVGSGVVGGVTVWWLRRNEVDKFKKEMSEKVKAEFKKLLDDEQVSAFKQQIRNSFVPFEEWAEKLNNDVFSLEKSLNILLESKRNKEYNSEVEAKRFKELETQVFEQLQAIEAEYKRIEQKILKSQSTQTDS